MQREEHSCRSWEPFPVAESLEAGGAPPGPFLQERLGPREPTGLCCVHGFWSSAGGGHAGGMGYSWTQTGTVAPSGFSGSSLMCLLLFCRW